MGSSVPHIAQFYEGEELLARGVAAFFAEGLRRGDPAVTASTPRTFDLVRRQLALEYQLTADAIDRIQLLDPATLLPQFMVGGSPDPARFERAVGELFTAIRAQYGDATVWLHGEMVSLLCAQGHHAAAVRLEELWNGISTAYLPYEILCTYPVESFDEDPCGEHLRAVCAQHTHLSPAYGFGYAPAERPSMESIVLLQHRARASERAISGPLTIYLIDDHASVRRSLARLIASLGLPVRSFASAEEFLEQVDSTARGCLILDCHLDGMNGPELQSVIAGAGWTLPIIAISGSGDQKVERDALRQGATLFLHKPIESNTLMSAILTALG